MSDKISVPKGLYYYPNAIFPELIDDVETWFHDSDTQESLFAVTNASGKSSDDSRRVLHFGWKYNYSTGGSQERAPDFPYVVLALRSCIKRVWDKAPKNFSIDSLDQCIVNRYKPGQGIGAHSDSKVYGDVVVCFTFEGGREMKFTRGSETYTLYTKPGSMYLMSGESRSEWKHEMVGRKSDKVDGKTVKRTECFSVTFRGVKTISSKSKASFKTIEPAPVKKPLGKCVVGDTTFKGKWEKAGDAWMFSLSTPINTEDPANEKIVGYLDKRIDMEDEIIDPHSELITLGWYSSTRGKYTPTHSDV